MGKVTVYQTGYVTFEIPNIEIHVEDNETPTAAFERTMAAFKNHVQGSLLCGFAQEDSMTFVHQNELYTEHPLVRVRDNQMEEVDIESLGLRLVIDVETNSDDTEYLVAQTYQDGADLYDETIEQFDLPATALEIYKFHQKMEKWALLNGHKFVNEVVLTSEAIIKNEDAEDYLKMITTGVCPHCKEPSCCPDGHGECYNWDLFTP